MEPRQEELADAAIELEAEGLGAVVEADVDATAGVHQPQLGG
jgi:hypothetical protein